MLSAFSSVTIASAQHRNFIGSGLLRRRLRISKKKSPNPSLMRWIKIGLTQIYMVTAGMLSNFVRGSMLRRWSTHIRPPPQLGGVILIFFSEWILDIIAGGAAAILQPWGDKPIGRNGGAEKKERVWIFYCLVKWFHQPKTEDYIQTY